MSGKEEELVDSNFLNHETFGRDAQPLMIGHIYVGTMFRSLVRVLASV